MATLAIDLKRRGIRLEDPLQRKQASTNTAAPPPSVGDESETEGEQSDFEFEEESVGQENIMPPSILKKPTKKTTTFAGVPSSRVDDQLSRLSLDNSCTIQSVKGFLCYSMLSGRWEQFDFEKDVMNGFCLMRMLIHNGSKKEDFQFSWVNNKTFKIRLKWPVFMQSSLMMTGLDRDSFGREIYPRGHQLYNEMGKNARDLKDVDGNIWTEGRFVFKKPMDTRPDKFDIKLFEVQVDQEGRWGTILQVLFHELTEQPEQQAPTMAPISVTRASIQFE